MSEVLADVDLPEVRATVEQRIGDGNGGPVAAYRLVIDGGRAHLEPVPPNSDRSETASGCDGGMVVMSQSRTTAEAVRRGEIGALAALQAGLIRVSGDVRVLIAAAEALALADAALGAALDGEHNSDTGHSSVSPEGGASSDEPNGEPDGGSEKS